MYKILSLIIIPVLLITGVGLHQQQSALGIIPTSENEVKFQKFRTECKAELGLSEDLTMEQMVKCNKALSSADPTIQEMIFRYNHLLAGIKSRLQAMKEGKCHIDELGKNICKGLDE
jgi:fructose-bisphosphate aldolase class 1